MQPKLCTKCKKNIAVVFITKVENGVTMNEGYCLRCARSLGIPQIENAVKQMGFSEEDLDTLSDEMSSMFAQPETDDEDDETEGRTATFPMLNQLFGGNNVPAKNEQPAQEQGEEKEPKKKKTKKQKFLDSYCMDLTGRAREGKLDQTRLISPFITQQAGQIRCPACWCITTIIPPRERPPGKPPHKRRNRCRYQH